MEIRRAANKILNSKQRRFSKQKTLACFISALASTDTSLLRRILSEVGVRSYDAYDFSIGDSIQEEITSKIKRADFAIIVYSMQAPNVLYEMGICVGLGKPIFVIIPPDMEVPYFIQNRLHLRTDLKDSSALRITLSKFVQELTATSTKPKRKLAARKSQIVSRHTLRDYLNKIHDLRKQGEGEEVESLVFQLFRSLALDVVRNEYSERDKGVDLAIWSDALMPTLGNPLLIEVKSGPLSPNSIRQAEKQLQKYIAETDAKAAILLYLDKHNRRFSELSFSFPFIIRFDLEDFVNELSKHPFEEIVLAQRNRIVHGASD